MIFITGDTHGRHDFEKLNLFASTHPQLSKKDYLIVAGDFGAVWDARTLDEDLAPYEALPFTLLFIDGNHENFDLLDNYPQEEWMGGKVHRVAEHILHLMRGQVYSIEGKSFFTFGGATSVDRYMRQEGISWWSQERPTDADIVEANRNLQAVGFKVDYIVTHSCDEKALYYPPLLTAFSPKTIFPENQILSYFEEIVEYRHWYFGHYHLDGDLTDQKTVLFNEIKEL